MENEETGIRHLFIENNNLVQELTIINAKVSNLRKNESSQVKYLAAIIEELLTTFDFNNQYEQVKKELSDIISDDTFQKILYNKETYVESTRSIIIDTYFFFLTYLDHLYNQSQPKRSDILRQAAKNVSIPILSELSEEQILRATELQKSLLNRHSPPNPEDRIYFCRNIYDEYLYEQALGLVSRQEEHPQLSENIPKTPQTLNEISLEAQTVVKQSIASADTGYPRRRIILDIITNFANHLATEQSEKSENLIQQRISII